MPQTFNVLKCSECFTFQSQLAKKSLKWKCNMCGRRQSIIQPFGTGSGFECRKQVQKLNGLRGQLDLLAERRAFDNISAQQIKQDTADNEAIIDCNIDTDPIEFQEGEGTSGYSVLLQHLQLPKK